MYYIYEITNNINGKNYIGQRKCPKNKLPETDIKYMGSGIALINAYKKYGKENFTKIIIESDIETIELVNEREIYWIAEYRKMGKAEYNISKGGDKIPNFYEYSLEKQMEIRKKMSEKHKGKKHTEEEILKIKLSNMGKNYQKKLKERLVRKIKEKELQERIYQNVKSEDFIKQNCKYYAQHSDKCCYFRRGCDCKYEDDCKYFDFNREKAQKIAYPNKKIIRKKNS